MSSVAALPAELHAGLCRRLRSVARARAALSALDCEIEAELLALRARHERRLRAASQRLARREGELEQLCRADRRRLFPADRRSLRTPFGRVGFRLGRPSVRLGGGVTDGDVCAALRRLGLERFIRCTERPERLALSRAVLSDEVTREDLRACGLEFVRAEESFYCEPDDGGAG